MDTQTHDQCTLFCANLSPGVNDADLRAHFMKFGALSARVSCDTSGRSRGFGYVTFSDEETAKVAMGAVNENIETGPMHMIIRIHKSDGRAAPKDSSRKGLSPETKVDAEIGTTVPKSRADANANNEPKQYKKPALYMEKPTSEGREKGLSDTHTSELEVAKLHAQIIILQRLVLTEKERHRVELEEAKSRREKLEEQKAATERALQQARKEQGILRAQAEKREREFSAMESRCKILEFEVEKAKRDRAKESEAREEAEKLRRKAEVEESARKMRAFAAEEKERAAAAAEKARQQRYAEQKSREQEEKEQKEQKEQSDLAEKRRAQQWRHATLKERVRCRQRDGRLKGDRAWTHRAALERFKALTEEFDGIKFSEAQPLAFENIPWPALTDPYTLKIEHIDWSIVEKFFGEASLAYKLAEYKALVEKTHRMFHPDKWHSKNILATVMDEKLRASLEKAGNIVSQAITPIWRKSRGHSD